jgi:hypothetical protein
MKERLIAVVQFWLAFPLLLVCFSLSVKIVNLV